jgi:structure-specific recognition protein 1
MTYILDYNKANMNLVLAFDKPLRQGNTSYPYIIFQFKKNKEAKVDLRLPKNELEQIHPDLQESYEGSYYEIVAKLFKLVIGINIIIPGEFKTSGGHAGLKCHVGNQEGLLFPLNKSLIFIKKPVIYVRLDDISHVEFHRVSGGHGVRGFDFEIKLKNGITTTFSGADRRELESIMNYFDKNKVSVKTVEESAKLNEDLGDMSEDDDRVGLNDGEEEEGDEEADGDFVAPDDDDEGDDEDGDYEGDRK